MKIKIFEGYSVEELEEQVNDWLLCRDGIDIVNIKIACGEGKPCGRNVVMIIYKVKR